MYKIIGADGREYGPASGDQLRQWITEGRVSADTQVLVDGSADWKPLRALAEFSSLLAGPTPPQIGPLTRPPGGTTLRKNHPFAVTGLILGIVFSLLGLAQIRKQPDAYSGQGLAIAGLICSIVSLTLAAALMTIGIAMSGNQILHELRKL